MKEKYDTKPGRALGSNGFRGNSELDILKDIARRLKELTLKNGDGDISTLNIFTLENQTSNQNYNAISITFVKMEEGTGTVILNGEDITDIINVLGSFTFNDNTPSSSPISIEVSGVYKALVSVRA